MSGNRIKRTTSWFVLASFLFPAQALCSSAATLDDLKKLEISCFVPSHLPEGFRLKKVKITYDELHEEFDDMNRPLPLYNLEYGNDRKATFLKSRRRFVCSAFYLTIKSSANFHGVPVVDRF